MTSASTNINDTTVQKLLECPVCLDVCASPKILKCGHHICANCELTMCRQHQSRVPCPICRVETDVQIGKCCCIDIKHCVTGGLATNYGLSNLIAHLTKSTSTNLNVCASCFDKVPTNKCFVCTHCNNLIVCSYCAVKRHNSHSLIDLDELLKKRRIEIEQWRGKIEDRCVDRLNSFKSQLETSKRQMINRCLSFNQLLVDEVDSRLRTIINDANKQHENAMAELNKFVRCENTDVSMTVTTEADCVLHENAIDDVADNMRKLIERIDRCCMTIRQAEIEVRKQLGIVEKQQHQSQQNGPPHYRTAVDLINFGLSPPSTNTANTPNSAIDSRSLSANLRRIGRGSWRYIANQNNLSPTSLSSGPSRFGRQPLQTHRPSPFRSTRFPSSPIGLLVSTDDEDDHTFQLSPTRIATSDRSSTPIIDSPPLTHSPVRVTFANISTDVDSDVELAIPHDDEEENDDDEDDEAVVQRNTDRPSTSSSAASAIANSRLMMQRRKRPHTTGFMRIRTPSTSNSSNNSSEFQPSRNYRISLATTAATSSALQNIRRAETSESD